MRKLTFIFSLLFLFLLFIIPKSSYAANEFLVDVNVDYKINESGNTTVTHNTTLENIFSTIYAKSYTLTLENIKAENIKAYQDNKPLEVTETPKDNLTLIKVNFPDELIGKGASRKFSVQFDVSDFAVRTGEVWEISVPKLSDSDAFRDYSTRIYVPKSFGMTSYISPDPVSKDEDDNSYIFLFNKEEVSKSPIQAGFGEFQVFTFQLNYHLLNPLAENAETTIPLPPDTSYQKVFYENINPKPNNITLDNDGNWIATYRLKPKERMDVSANGSVQIFANPREFDIPSEETLKNNLKPTEYWQSDSSTLQSMAKSLSSPKDIYNYVIKTLSYDYDRVKPNVQRLGAVEALKNPNSAICMEFTDLFIALARAKGIPAREVNGYAYTENTQIQPLSLVADVLHSWPEYWDSNKKSWIQVDPTWGDTTNGMDYFSNSDLRHFTFVIHGADPSKPFAPGSYKLGPNPQKDVYVNFGKLPETRTAQLSVSADVVKKFPFFQNYAILTVENNGPVAAYSITPEALMNSKSVQMDTIDFIPPFSSRELFLKIPYSFLGLNTPDIIKFKVLDKSVDISGFKTLILLNSLLILFISLTLFILILLLMLKFKRRKQHNINGKITTDPKTNTIIEEGDKKTT